MTVFDTFIANRVFVLNDDEYTFLAIEDAGRVKAKYIKSGFSVSLHPSIEYKLKLN